MSKKIWSLLISLGKYENCVAVHYNDSRYHQFNEKCFDFFDIRQSLSKIEYFKNSTYKCNLISGYTPQHWAAMYGKLNILEYLLDRVENINPENAQKMTPLHLAAKNGHSEVATFLRDFASDSNPKNKTGITPLHLAAQNGYLDIVQSLMLIILDPESKNPGINYLNPGC